MYNLIWQKFTTTYLNANFQNSSFICQQSEFEIKERAFKKCPCAGTV